MDANWGLCKSCKWWQIEPDANVGDRTMGHCNEEELQPFSLRVSGDSGCSRYAKGKPARAEGAGAQPPAVGSAR